VQLEKQLETIEDRRFVDLAHLVIKRAQTMLNAGKIPFARIEIENSDEWQTLWRYDRSDDCSAVLLWLEELLEAL
jgi:hypothetical protein